MTIFGSNKDDLILILNDFPYNLEKSIIHYIAWLRPGQTTYRFEYKLEDDLLTKIKDILKS